MCVHARVHGHMYVMEGHLFHFCSHVYTLNNPHAGNMTVRCRHPLFQHIQQKPGSEQCMFHSCVLPVCLIVLLLFVCMCNICVFSFSWFSAIWIVLKRNLKSVCETVRQTSITSTTAYLTPRVREQCVDPTLHSVVIVCYFTSASQAGTLSSFVNVKSRCVLFYSI